MKTTSNIPPGPGGMLEIFWKIVPLGLTNCWILSTLNKKRHKFSQSVTSIQSKIGINCKRKWGTGWWTSAKIHHPARSYLIGTFCFRLFCLSIQQSFSCPDHTGRPTGYSQFESGADMCQKTCPYDSARCRYLRCKRWGWGRGGYQRYPSRSHLRWCPDSGERQLDPRNAYW